MGDVFSWLGSPAEPPHGDDHADDSPCGDRREVSGGEAASLRVRAEARSERLDDVLDRKDPRYRDDPARRSFEREDAREEEQTSSTGLGWGYAAL